MGCNKKSKYYTNAICGVSTFLNKSIYLCEDCKDKVK